MKKNYFYCIFSFLFILTVNNLSAESSQMQKTIPINYVNTSQKKEVQASLKNTTSKKKEISNYNDFDDQSVIEKSHTVTVSLEDIYKNSFDFFQSLRNSKGIYRDSLCFDGNNLHPGSSASIGMGLISLCIGDAKRWIPNAKNLVIISLQSLEGKTEGFKPDRNKTGFFRHWFDMETGAQSWNSEYSTIDTAILMYGVLFAKNYFHSPEIDCYADKLSASIDWSVTIADPEVGSIYRELLSDGSGDATKLTLPFNEYILVAWLAKNTEKYPGKATLLWNKHYKTPKNLPSIDYEGISLLTDGSGYLSNFIVQFAYYLCHPITVSAEYNSYIKNTLKADKLWWSHQKDSKKYTYGLGAGSSLAGSGYKADSIGNNKELTVSPHIIAGLLPFDPKGKDNLLSLINNSYGIYSVTDNNIDVLWRFSLSDKTWKPADIQGVDYALMLFGLTADSLGVDFFSTNNNFFNNK